jgi:hypothetical protein
MIQLTLDEELAKQLFDKSVDVVEKERIRYCSFLFMIDESLAMNH